MEERLEILLAAEPVKKEGRKLSDIQTLEFKDILDFPHILPVFFPAENNILHYRILI